MISKVCVCVFSFCLLIIVSLCPFYSHLEIIINLYHCWRYIYPLSENVPGSLKAQVQTCQFIKDFYIA